MVTVEEYVAALEVVRQYESENPNGPLAELGVNDNAVANIIKGLAGPTGESGPAGEE